MDERVPRITATSEPNICCSASCVRRESIAASVLKALGLNYDDVRRDVANLLAQSKRE